MAERMLIAIVRSDEKDDGTLIVASPVVGMVDGAPKTGVFLNPLDQILTIKILNRRYVLRLPRDGQGRITESFVPNEYTPVAFGQPLARLDPRGRQAETLVGGAGDASASVAGQEGEAALISVTAPSEGIFYRRSSPDTPPFIEVGDEVSTGSVLGLVEVMKCFNQITYGGPELPAKGRVVRILAEDSSEVKFGEVLFRVKPVE